MSLDLLKPIGGFLYLASPYTLYRDGRHMAFSHVRAVAKRMHDAGLRVYSPIARTHPIAESTGIDPLDDLWLKINSYFIERAAALVVARLEGWSASRGTVDEIAAFGAAGKPIFFLDPFAMQVETEAAFLARGARIPKPMEISP